MSNYIGDAIAASIGAWMFIIFAAGAGVTLFIVFAIPWLWRLIKPWLHAVTG
jgi:hypothetical protein